MSSGKGSVKAIEQAEKAAEKTEEKVEYSVSNGLVGRLAKLNISIALSSYQSGVLYFIGRNSENGINIHQAPMPRPMGLCMDDKNRLTMTAGHQIMQFENCLQAGQKINHIFDACYVPRLVHITGRLDAHDVGLDSKGQPVFVNTRFNCLSIPSTRHSFEVIWKPSFITDIVDEDRCHLNGLAMENGKPKYVTAVSRSNTIDGWRDRRTDGGIVIDVESNEIVCEGLSMPHSPRIHNGQLWLLNAGTGEFGKIEFNKTGKGKFKAVTFCPGFLRGLRFHGNLAFVGLSKPRYKRFEGLALDQKLKDADSEPWCGIQIIDLSTGACVDWFRIDGTIGEVFDVEVIPGAVTPMAVSPTSDELASLITYEGMQTSAGASAQEKTKTV